MRTTVSSGMRPSRAHSRIFLFLLGLLLFLCPGPVVGRAEENASRLVMVSLDFKEADIQVVLQALARKAGVNIVASKEVSGAVTIHLDNVSWEQALETIVTNYGYGYERNDNVVLVSTLEELKNRRETMKQLVEIEPIITKVLELKYLSTAEAKAFLESQISPQGRISVLEVPTTSPRAPGGSRPKAVVITDTRTTVNRLEKILSTMDVPGVQPAGPPSSSPEEKAVPKEQLLLQGIVFDSKALSYAIINGKIVGEMDDVDGAKVLKIEPTTVTVLMNGQEIPLTVRQPQPAKEKSKEP